MKVSRTLKWSSQNSVVISFQNFFQRTDKHSKCQITIITWIVNNWHRPACWASKFRNSLTKNCCSVNLAFLAWVKLKTLKKMTCSSMLIEVWILCVEVCGLSRSRTFVNLSAAHSCQDERGQEHWSPTVTQLSLMAPKNRQCTPMVMLWELASAGLQN